MDELQRNDDDGGGGGGDGLNALMDSLQQTHGLSSSTCASAVANDARLEFISSYTLTTLRLKQDKWYKMMATPEYQRILFDWLNNTQRRVLVMSLNPAGLLVPKNSISDLYQNYSTHLTRIPSSTHNPPSMSDDIHGTGARGQTAEASTSTLSNTTTAAATVAASVAMTPVTAPVMMAPLPPPSSSFSTLDGVPRGKCAFFLRRELGRPLTSETFQAQIICGDFPVHSKIDTLLILFDEILQPLLENPLNRSFWPEVVGKDLNSRLKDVRNILTEIKGKTNNRTILSLLVSPRVLEEVASHIRQQQQQGTNEDPAALDAKLRGQLEEMVINWTTQVHEIINEKSACVSNAQKGRAATNLVVVSMPIQEVNFWINRQRNLENVYDQLRSQPHKCVTFILEANDSPYHRPFANILKSVVCAWHEAQDVSLWLQPLLRHTAAFNAVSFANAHELIVPLVHVVHLIWSNSRHYRSTPRMTVLLRCICNLLIRRANEDLEMATLFQTDADEGLSKITRTVAVLEMFKSKMLHYKSKYSSNQTILPALTEVPAAAGDTEDTSTIASALAVHQLWRFSNEDVFGYALDDFLAQLFEVQTVFEAAVVFQSLDKLEFGGCMGKFLTERTRQIHTEFTMLFEEWTKLEIDVSHTHSHLPTTSRQDSRWRTFKQEQARFFEHMQVIEKKLATTLIQAYGDCHNWEQLSKLTMMFANIVQRQTIQFELRIILAHILGVYERELVLIERIVSEVLLSFEYRGIEAIPLDRTNFPATAGAMVWLEQHMKRCDVFTAPELNALLKVLVADNPLSPQFEKLTARRNILTTKLSNLQLKIWHNWQQTIEKRIARGLDSKVMMLHNSSHGRANGPCHRRERTNVVVDAANVACANTIGNHARCHNVSTIGIGESSSSSSSPAGDTKILEINFSIELYTLLRETKYLLALQQLRSPDNFTHNSGHHHHHQLPQALLDLYAQRDIFWQRKIKLMQLAEYYNIIREGLSASIEMQLIHPAVNDIDEHLESAVDELTWRHYDDQIVHDLHGKAETLYRHLDEARKNVQLILNSIRRWSLEPLHQRSIYGKNLLEIRNQQQRLRTRLLQCVETKSLLNRLLAQNFCLFFNYEMALAADFHDGSIHEFLINFPEEQCNKFNRYLEFIDHMIYEQVRETMKISLGYLLNEMTATATAETTTPENGICPAMQMQNPTVESTTAATTEETMDLAETKATATTKHFLPRILKSMQTSQPSEVATPAVVDYLPAVAPTTAKAPLFEVKLHLHHGAKINFEPTFDSNVANNFRGIVKQLLSDIQLACDGIPRVFPNTATPSQGNDNKATQRTATSAQSEDDEIQRLHTAIQSAVSGTIKAAEAFALQFEVYAPLWTENYSRVLNRQLRDSEHCSLPTGEKEFLANKGFHVMETFKREIERYAKIHDVIEQFHDSKTINGWLLIDIKPLKYCLLNMTCKWSQYYKRALLIYVERALQKFTHFICRGLELLQLHVARDDFSTLLKVLEVIARIKQKEVYADNLFKPLKEIVQLLKTYHVQFNSQFARSIDQLPVQWQYLKTMAATKMESLHDTKLFQQHRVSAISLLFMCHLNTFVQHFQQMAFFKTPCSRVYSFCDEVSLKMHNFDIHHKRISHCAQLLDIAPPEDNTLRVCATELKRVKQLWDFVHVIESCINQWRASPWLLIDTDDIENECKQFSRDLRTLDKSIREWAPYLYIVGVLRELVASLRTITELQNSAITERHWKELMHETKERQKTIKQSLQNADDYLISRSVCGEICQLVGLLRGKSGKYTIQPSSNLSCTDLCTIDCM